MFKVMFGLSITLFMAIGAIAILAEGSQPKLLSNADLSSTVGGGCQNCMDDDVTCSVEDHCVGYKKVWGQDLTRRYCGSAAGVCDCNHDDLPLQECTRSASCLTEDCWFCGLYFAESYAHTQCILDGANCTKNEDCDG